VPRIPTYRSKRLPSTNVGQAPLNPSAANLNAQAPGRGFIGMQQGLSNLGQGMANLGGKIFQVEQDKQELIDINSSIQAKNLRKMDAAQQERDEAELPPDQWAERARTRAVDLNTKIAKLPFSDRARGLEELNNQYHVEAMYIGADTRATKKIIKDTTDNAELDYLQSVSNTGLDSDETKTSFAKLDAVYSKTLTEEAKKESIKNLTEKGQVVFADTQVKNIIPRLVDKLRSGETWQKEHRYSAQDKREARDYDEQLLNDLVDKGIIDRYQMEESARKHANWIDDKAEEDIAIAKQATYDANITAYKEIIPALKSRELKRDDVERLNLDDEIKDRLKRYVSGSYEDAPVGSSVSGFDNIIGTVSDFQHGKLSELEAYDQLLDERYKYRTITQAEFDWAIAHIQKPYDSGFFGTMRDVLSSNRDDYNGWVNTKADKAKAMSVNQDLIKWVDSQIDKGKEPSSDAMAEQSDLFRAGKGSTDSQTTTDVATEPPDFEPEVYYPLTQEELDDVPSGAIVELPNGRRGIK